MLFNPDEPLERIDGETKRANAAFADYALLGAARSYRSLLARYKSQVEQPPTRSWNTLTAWASKFEWVERAERFDALQLQRAQQAYEARRKEYMETGLALAHERVQRLVSIYERLYEDFQEDDNLWMPDQKGIGSAENFQVVDIIHFNTQLIDQLRGVLDDIAHEVGGRVKVEKIDSTVTNLNISADDLAAARQKARAYEKELLGEDEPAAPGAA